MEGTLLQRVQRLEDLMRERIDADDRFVFALNHQRERIDEIVGAEPEVVKTAPTYSGPIEAPAIDRRRQ